MQDNAKKVKLDHAPKKKTYRHSPSLCRAHCLRTWPFACCNGSDADMYEDRGRELSFDLEAVQEWSVSWLVWSLPLLRVLHLGGLRPIAATRVT